MHTRGRALVAVAMTIGLALTVAGLVRANGGSDYAKEVAEVCRSVDDRLRHSTGTYFEAVVMSSQARAAGLARLRPDAAHAALQADLVAVEARLTTAAQSASQLYRIAGASAVVGHFRSLRTAELQQNERYGTLGIQGCAD